jgi:MvaI/BcnI restriction endonuclease family
LTSSCDATLILKKRKTDRLNIGGIYACKKAINPNTGLRLRMIGFDQQEGKIADLKGGLALLDQQDNLAAFWKFTGIIEHWNRKHAQAAYVPSLHKMPPPQYCYGPKITLCEGTDLGLFLNAVAKGMVYLDPALKIETINGVPKPKKRNQFRIKHADLKHMYHRVEEVEL